MIWITPPRWLQKPKHDDWVSATDKGWVVDKTGEVLVSVKDLDKKIEQYVEELEHVSKIAREAVRRRAGRKPGSKSTANQASDE